MMQRTEQPGTYYDAHRCGGFSAHVFRDDTGELRADVYADADLTGLRARDLRHLIALCEALLRRAEQADNPPIMRAIE